MAHSKKIVKTGYRENYAIHDWDANGRKGECPFHWKEKWGSTYLFTNATYDEVEKVIVHSDEYIEDYLESVSCVINQTEIDDAWEDYEHRYMWTKLENGEWIQEQLSPKTGVRSGLKGYRYTWKYKNIEDANRGKHYNYSVQYYFENGMVANSEDEATKIFEEVVYKSTIYKLHN